MTVKEILKQLKSGNFDKKILAAALLVKTEKAFMPIFRYSEELCEANFGRRVYIRGIIEFSNRCRRNCNYCGIRRDNKKVKRYRVTAGEAMESVKLMHGQGVHTVVLQSGEDINMDTEMLSLVTRIKKNYDMAITLSIGERPVSVYEEFRKAGADRFLLRIETTDRELFKQLHPDDDFDNRMNCLSMLRSLKFEVGTGIMLGLPGQSVESIAADLLFFKKFMPEMVGIGPFLPQSDTPLRHEKGGDLFLTLKAMALARILLPGANIPATTAMGTVDPKGRQKALMYGANVIMPNYTPLKYKKHYMLYDKKICVSEMCARACADKIAMEAGKKILTGKGFSKLCGRSEKRKNPIWNQSTESRRTRSRTTGEKAVLP